MFIKILGRDGTVPKTLKERLFLIWDDWNDYSFKTLFGVFFIDADLNKHSLGGVKIGFYGQKESDTKLKIGDKFDELPPEFFSLGVDEFYYEKLNMLGATTRNQILKALRDIAKSPNIYKKAIFEKVTQISLFRGVTETEVERQFRRMTRGGSRLTPFKFEFKNNRNLIVNNSLLVRFEVNPESNPPTNIHVLIGRNGSGKTTVIKNMVKVLVSEEDRLGKFNYIEAEDIGCPFPNLIAISFSAFDESELEMVSNENNSKIKYEYIGLKRKKYSKYDLSVVKSPAELQDEFVDSLKECKGVKSKKDRWKQAIQILEYDQTFKDQNIIDLINVDKTEKNEIIREEEFLKRAGQTFSSLSSGHKIVLLSITRLIEGLEEKSLVLIDEPETHLHPPLLSAFIRTISDLLTLKNGVAICYPLSGNITGSSKKLCLENKKGW